MESDPAFPHPQPLTRAGFDVLGVRGVHSCRRVVRKKPSRKRKRRPETAGCGRRRRKMDEV